VRAAPAGAPGAPAGARAGDGELSAADHPRRVAAPLKQSASTRISAAAALRAAAALILGRGGFLDERIAEYSKRRAAAGGSRRFVDQTIIRGASQHVRAREKAASATKRKGWRKKGRRTVAARRPFAVIDSPREAGAPACASRRSLIYAS